MEKAAARLRRTVHYPDNDDDENSLRDALDEQAQEQLIEQLAQKNAHINLLYTRVLLVIAVISTAPYVATIATAPTLLCLLAISSLLSTAYLLYELPAGTTGLWGLDALDRSISRWPYSTTTYRRRGRHDTDGRPIIHFLPYLNVCLCSMLIVLGCVGPVEKRATLWLGFSWLPAVVSVMVVAAKWVMGSVDPEGELSRLKYNYKGA